MPEICFVPDCDPRREGRDWDPQQCPWYYQATDGLRGFLFRVWDQVRVGPGEPLESIRGRIFAVFLRAPGADPSNVTPSQRDFPASGPSGSGGEESSYRWVPFPLTGADDSQLVQLAAEQIFLAVRPAFVDRVFGALSGRWSIYTEGDGVAFMRRATDRAAGYRTDAITIYTRSRHDSMRCLAAIETLMRDGSIRPDWLRPEAPPHALGTHLPGVSWAERDPRVNSGLHLSGELAPALRQMADVSGMTRQRWVCVALAFLRDTTGLDPHRPWLVRR